MTMAAGRGRRHLQMQGAKTKRLTLAGPRLFNTVLLFFGAEAEVAQFLLGSLF